MAGRSPRAALIAFAFFLTLCIPARAFADACDDAWNAYEQSRDALTDAANNMRMAEAAAEKAPAGPGGDGAREAARKATDAWLEANNEMLRRRNETDKCPPRQVRIRTGKLWPYGYTVTQVSIWTALAPFFNMGSSNDASGLAARPTSSLQASPAPGGLGRVALSVGGGIDLSRSFGSTTPSFFGGLLGAVPLTSHPEFLPFGEVLLGIERCGECGTTDFAVEFGFGTEYRRPEWDRLGVVVSFSFRTYPGADFAGVGKRLLGGVTYRLAP